MLVNRHDYRLTDQGGYGVGYQLLNTSAFDPSEVDVALQLLDARRQAFGDGVVAIDCGANVGVHTIEWAQAMFGWGNVISFEAQERIFYALAGNITLNNCFNARAIWAAAGKETGTIQVPIPDYFTPSSFGSLEIRKREKTEFIGQDIDYAMTRTQTTPLMSIDALNLNRIDFIKIDVEGMEMDVLEGAKNSIARFKPHLLIEKIKTNEIDLMNFLEPQDYKTFPVGINILAVHKDDPLTSRITMD
jgi:FkbM family methyltransferase